MLPSLLLIKLLTLLSVSPYATPFSIRSVGTCVLCQPHASSTLKAGSTLYDKIYAEHLIPSSSDKEFTPLIYIDRHLIHEVTSPQAFEGLRLSNRKVRRPDCTLATVDHNVPTSDRKQLLSVEDFISETQSKTQVLELEKNVDAFSLKYFGLGDSRQGIVHIIGPEQGFTLPGSTVVCGDSHTATHGAFGALAFGIGTSEVEHVLATQTLEQTKSKNMLIEITGTISPSVKSKDIVLHICGVIGTAGGTGCAIEFGGEGVRALSMEARMSISNMAIEAGARAGLIAPDETTFEYLKGRPMSPSPGREWDEALEHWRTLKSDPDAKWDKVVTIKAEDIEPSITWGTSPQDVVNINGKVPTTESSSDPARQAAITRSLDYIGLSPGGMPIKGVPIDKVFIGSCTNGRIEDLRDVAAIALGRKVKEGVDAMIVPGSGLVKRQAEKEGLDKIFAEAGFDFREPGCSMCLAMNDDKLKPQERCASTSNRNFEGRQGDGGRTHLVSPMMAAAAAIKGAIDDVREYEYLGDESNDPRRFNSRTDRGSDTFTTEVLVNPGPIINENDEICEDIEEKKIVDGDCEPVSSGLPNFTVLTGKAAPLDIQNVDTDMIIPKEFLKTIKRSGLGFAAFAELRYTNALAVATIGEEVADERKEFILNTDPYKGKAKILIAGDNFGCGSSREHAPWAINDMGLRCIISNSFADIFYNNCLNNGMLPIKLSRPEVEELLEIAGDPDNEITVNLPDQVVITKTNSYKFEIDQFKKFCLVNGLDKIGLTLERIADIRKFEEKRSKERPYFDGAAMKAPDEVKMYENAPIWSVQTGVGAP